MRVARPAVRTHSPLLAAAREKNRFTATTAAPLTHHYFGSVDVNAALDGAMDDPIHAPIIEDFRREHGLPFEGESPGEPPLGPSDAEIKYQLNVPPPAPAASVFYVSFQNVTPPNAPDHTQANPGPTGTGANRAGYVRVRLQKQGSISWDIGAPDSSGQVPVSAQSVNVFYRLDPIELFVSSTYAASSCPYRVTLAHERSHVTAFTTIFHAARASLVNDLGTLSVPTQAAPARMAPAAVAGFQNTLGTQFQAVVIAHSRTLVNAMEADRNAKDSPAAYALVHAQCPATDW